MQNLLCVFVRSPNKRDKKLIEDMLRSAQINQFQIIDVNAVDVATLGRCEYGMAFGRICGRIVKDLVSNLLVFPQTKNLYKDPKNEESRLKAKDLLAKLVLILNNPQEEKVQQSTATGAFLQTPKGSLYVSNMTSQEAQDKANICLTVEELEIIDELKNIFSADQVQVVTQ